MADVLTWIAGTIIVALLIYQIGLRGLLLPHAFAVRLKKRDALGREPLQSELTRTQSFLFALAAFSELHPTMLGMSHHTTGAGEFGGGADVHGGDYMSGGDGGMGGDGGGGGI